MREAKLVETYAAVKDKPILEKEIEEIQVARRELLVKGTINQEKLLKYSAIAILAITMFRYILNLIFVPTLKTVLFFPLILGYITIYFIPIPISLHLYSVIRYRINPKLPGSKAELDRLAKLEEKKKDKLRVAKNIISNSEVPVQYRTEEILELFVHLVENDLVKNMEEAIHRFEEYKRKN